MNSETDPKRFRRHHAYAERTTAPLCGDIFTVYRTLVISAALRHCSNGSKDFLIPHDKPLGVFRLLATLLPVGFVTLQTDRLASVEELLHES